jgi:hypothetical protein
MVLAAVCLVAFLTTLAARVSASGPDPFTIAATASGAACIALGGVANALVAGAMAFGSMPEPNSDVLRFGDTIGFPFITVGGMLFIAFVIARLTLAARHSGLFGQGLAAYSLISAALTLLSFLFFPLLLTLIWFLVVGIVLTRRGEDVTARPSGL